MLLSNTIRGCALFLPLGWVLGFVLSAPSVLTAQNVYRANQIPANGVRIEYELKIESPANHLYSVEIDIRGIRDSSVRMAMPAWAPGDHRIQEFARNVQNFQVKARSGNRPLAWRKIDTHTWEILKREDDDAVVTYEVYSSHLTSRMADISPPAIYMYVVGHTHVPVALRYDKPRSWDVYTALEERGGAYRAPDYDVFVDAPALVTQARVLRFDSGNVEYRLVFADRTVEFSEEQVLFDIREIVNAAVQIFGSAPFQRYTFLFALRSQPGSDGLGHLNSARITVGRGDFSSGGRYDGFLFVVAREFFYAWNGKRIRPASESKLDYSGEAYSHSLWVMDGLSDYYARLLLARTGILDPQAYLIQLGQQIDRLQHQAGRLMMSLEEASWDVWAPSENAVNNSISHRTKGEIVGFLLDLEIRARSNSARSLDDVLRYLTETYADHGTGMPDQGFLEALHAVTGTDFAEFYTMAIQSRAELDYSRYTRQAALDVRPERQLPVLYMGVQVAAADGNLAQVARVLERSPAREAGLEEGDILIAFDDNRVTFANFESEFRRRRLGEQFEVTILRDDRLLQLDLEPREFQPEIWRVVEVTTATEAQVEVRDLWLGQLD